MVCIGCMLTAAVQWNVVVEICHLKSRKKTWQYLLMWNLMMYVVMLILYAFIMSAKWTEWNHEISRYAFFRPSVLPSVRLCALSI